MLRLILPAVAACLLGLNPAIADDGLGLARGADGANVSISGVSSGAAMAVQYAVAHSGSVVGVGSIAGPLWGCADGRVSRAINDCMCGRTTVAPVIGTARALAARADGAVDGLVSGKPAALGRAYVFHSDADHTVVAGAGQANAAFLGEFIGRPPVFDRGSPGDASDRAGHGIVSPDGGDACSGEAPNATYVRRCGADDNAGRLFHALYGQGTAYDPGKRVDHIPATELWTFDQQRVIDEVKQAGSTIASDKLWFGLFPYRSERRLNLDLAATGYLFVPAQCRQAGSKCPVHVALHGCKQDVRNFAAMSGYNNWAAHYGVIVVYPAVQPGSPQEASVCSLDPVPSLADVSWVEPNDNGCWDWWGYLDTGAPDRVRYLTKKAPQMQVIERIIGEVTRPLP